jgi:hypothetical protein
MSAHLFDSDDFHGAGYLVDVARIKLFSVFIKWPQDYPPGVAPRFDVDSEEALQVLAVLVQQLVKVELPLDNDIL